MRHYPTSPDTRRPSQHEPPPPPCNANPSMRMPKCNYSATMLDLSGTWDLRNRLPGHTSHSWPTIEKSLLSSPVLHRHRVSVESPLVSGGRASEADPTAVDARVALPSVTGFIHDRNDLVVELYFLIRQQNAGSTRAAHKLVLGEIAGRGRREQRRCGRIARGRKGLGGGHGLVGRGRRRRWDRHALRKLGQARAGAKHPGWIGVVKVVGVGLVDEARVQF